MGASSVAIVGAGIGGLTAALALARQGRHVTLVERRPGFAEIGAGIQLSPNASRVLVGLGLGAALKRAASEPDRAVVRDLRSGRTIGAVAQGRFMRERFGAPYWVIHRADLQTLLLDAVRAQPNVRLMLGRTLAGADPDGGRLSIGLQRTGGARETVSADLLIGADGVRSGVRALAGDRREPVYQGTGAWRATVAREAVPPELSGNETGLWLGRAGHVVHYPIAGGRLVNVVAVEPRPQPVEGWSAAADPRELADAFRGAAPALRALLDAAQDWQLWSLFDLPARRMADGRIALLGDAAHPVLPFLAQGGALAIEDAAVLAHALEASTDDPVAALRAYATSRASRARRVQNAARGNGRAYHAPAPIALVRNLVMRRLGPEGLAERYAWLYGWTPPA